MTHSYQTSVLKTRRCMATNFYQAEVEDFNNDFYSFEVTASCFAEANEKVTLLAMSEGIDIYNVNIYKN